VGEGKGGGGGGGEGVGGGAKKEKGACLPIVIAIPFPSLHNGNHYCLYFCTTVLLHLTMFKVGPRYWHSEKSMDCM
jgi:hypothetical protein